MLLRPYIGVLCVILLTCGCAVDQHKEVALYRSVLDGAHHAHVEYLYNEPLSLPQALLLCNQNNEQLAIQGEDYVQSLIDKERAVANFLPTLTLLPSYSKAQGSSDSGGRTILSGAGQSQSITSSLASGGDATDVPLNGNINLFRGFRDVATLERSKAEIRRNRALLLDLQASVLLDVAQTYYQVLRSEAAVRVLENSAQVQNERVQEMRTRDQVGAASKLDVAQTEAQAAATRAQLVAARSDVRTARALLALVVNAPVADAPLVDRLDLPGSLPPVEAFIAAAERGRQDLRAVREEVAAARQNVQVAYGQYYPTISLNLNYYLSRQSAPRNSDWNALISASVPLFEAGRIHADYRTALSQLRQAKSRETLLYRQIVQQTFSAYENTDVSQRRMTELRVETVAAQQALDVAEAQFRTGGGTYLDQLIAQDRLLSAQLDLTNELFNRKLQYLNLLRTIGELNRPPTAQTLSPQTYAPVPGSGAPVASPTTVPLTPQGEIMPTAPSSQQTFSLPPMPGEQVQSPPATQPTSRP